MVKLKPALLIALFLFISFQSFSQTKGLIIEPATGSVLDPNGDGYISSSSSGFTNFTDDTGEFEGSSWQDFPTFGGGEVLTDIRSGPDYGFTDFSFDPDGVATYVRSDGTNLIFRFRLADFRPNAKGYTVLIDSDGQFGSLDPNANPDNPGFEVAIVLRSKHGVYVYDIENKDACSSPVLTYSLASHHQKAISGISNDTDLDMFYDFYVPISDLTGSTSITSVSPLRIAATTNTSNTCALDGSLSDIGGLDDRGYGDCLECAFSDLIENQAPCTISGGLSCSSSASQTACPTLETALEAGTTSVSGTSESGAEVYINVTSGGSKTTYSTTADGSGNWSKTVSALANDDVVVIRALSSGKKYSDKGCSISVVSAPCDDSPKYTVVLSPNGGNDKLSGNIDGTDVTAIEMQVYLFNTDLATTLAGGVITNGYKSSEASPSTGAQAIPAIYSAAGASSTWDFQAGSNPTDADFPDKNIYAVRMRQKMTGDTEFRCWSDFQLFCGKCTGSCSSPIVPTITTSLSASTTTIEGSATGSGDGWTVGDKVYVYMNNSGLSGEGTKLVGVGEVDVAGSGSEHWSVSLADPLGNYGCGTLIAKVLGQTSGTECVSDPSAETATPSTSASNAPTITADFCGDVTEIYGTSTEPEGTEINV